MSRQRLSVSVFLAVAAVVLVPWTIWLASSLPCRYLAQHWRIAWAGFDSGLAASLALLAADAWFDVVTARGALALALATTEAVAIELPVAALCLRVAQRHAPSDRPDHHTTATPNPKGALQ